MKRYSLAPSSARKAGLEGPATQEATLELERLEQEATLVLQEIDKNLSRSNAIINDKIFPIIRKYATASDNVWKNVNYWKYFFEAAANAEIASYESPTVTNDINTTQKNLLLADDEDTNHASDENAHLSEQRDKFDANTGLLDKFKKPYLKGNIDEATPTWSTNPQKVTTSAKDYAMASSTPQLAQSTHPGHRPAHVFDSSDNSLQPPRRNSPQKDSTVTYTIRQSLDNYQKITISPKKARVQTPREKSNRRSSIIQELINSSPTLPEPPVLMSEIGNRKELASSNELDRLAPIDVSNHEIGSKPTEEMQRFPTTPQFSQHGARRTSNIVSTPVKLNALAQDDDSDLHPPVETNLEEPRAVADNNNDEEEEDVPFPDLETIELKKRVEQVKKRKLDENAEDNVFIDNDNDRSKNTSFVSTVYHSILNQQQGSPGSKENTNKSNSNMFDDVLEDIRDQQETNEEEQDASHNSSHNTTSELGSILHERFKKFLGQ